MIARLSYVVAVYVFAYIAASVHVGCAMAVMTYIAAVFEDTAAIENIGMKWDMTAMPNVAERWDKLAMTYAVVATYVVEDWHYAVPEGTRAAFVMNLWGRNGNSLLADVPYCFEEMKNNCELRAYHGRME